MLATNLLSFSPLGWRTYRGFGAVLLAADLLVGGCASQEPREHMAIHPHPPPGFLCGPVGALLAGSPGFSAQITMTNLPTADRKAAVSGFLLGRGDWLMFSPERSAGKSKTGGSGWGYIWNVASGQGWLLCEALQGYAPISSGVHYTNVGYAVVAAPPLAIDGRPCGEETATVGSSDGTTNVYRMWRSLEASGLPARVVQAGGEPPFKLSITQARPGAPPPDAFHPPEEFKEYSGADALLAELLVRKGDSLRTRPARRVAGVGAAPFMGGPYERGRDVRGYRERGNESRGATHPGGRDAGDKH
jgi:hypothetical protein